MYCLMIYVLLDDLCTFFKMNEKKRTIKMVRTILIVHEQFCSFFTEQTIFKETLKNNHCFTERTIFFEQTFFI